MEDEIILEDLDDNMEDEILTDDVDIDEDESESESTNADDDADLPLDEYGEPIKPDADPKPEPKPEPVVEDKPTQTKEDNARFAEERRQRQVQEALQNSPEYKLAKELADFYGKPVDEIIATVQEAKLRKIAEQRQMPYEAVKEIDDVKRQQEETKEQLTQLAYANWQKNVQAEMSQIKQEYPMLTDEDLEAAKTYTLTVLKRLDAPLSEAVFAVHGKKITDSVRESARQEELARISGRKTSALPPQGTRSTPTTNGLSEDQRAAAKIFGMSEKEYLKWSKYSDN